ncbi:MAG: 4Fe-4S binding protein [Gammaproteobacteria bacterium]
MLNSLEHTDGLQGLCELIVEEELCVNLRGRTLSCSNCQDACPSKALTPSLNAVELDQAKCTGCNSCLPSCPAGALRSIGFIPKRFIAAMSGQGRVDLHCRASSDAGGGIVIPCHGVLDARLVAAARAEGVTTLALHGLSNCEQCSYGDARVDVEQVSRRVSEWLGAAAPIMELDPHAVEQRSIRDHQDQPHLSRRAFLRFGGARAITQAAEWIVPGLGPEEHDAEVLPFYQSSVYPQRAAQYQAVLARHIDQVPWAEGAPLPWKQRSVTASCSGCLVCGERCPTGALIARENGQTRELSFDPTMCTDCSLCERVCPEGAMLARSLVSLDEVNSGRSLLFHLQQQLCSSCGAPFVPTGPEMESCLVCSNEQELDEEWLCMLSE